MNRLASAGWPVVAAASLLAATIGTLSVLGWPLYYDVIFALWPNLTVPEDSWTWLDVGYLGAALMLVVPAAAAFGWWLSSRMVHPLLDVARAARAIADGDLSARANTKAAGFWETRHLIDDFNAMAERLERGEADRIYTNSAIAHELRTPLTILKGRLQGVSDGVFALTPEMLDTLLAQVDGLAMIVEDLRTIGLFNADRLQLNLIETDLMAVVRRAVATVSVELEDADIELDLRLQPVVVKADPDRVRQALVALLTNATRYAQGTRVIVEIVVEPDLVSLRCTDHGPGLPDGAAERVFDPFWRVDDSRGRVAGGSGLGLAVVKAIAVAHGGSVSASNARDGGASFTLRLPR